MRIRDRLRKFDWKGWLGWMASTMVGLQIVVITIFFAFFENNFDRYWWGELGTVSVAGISLGVCQWAWLRRRLSSGGWWILSTLLGWDLAWLLGKLPDSTGVLSQLVQLFRLLTIPLAFSLPQWFFIRRVFRKATWWWVVARPFAWLAGYGLVALVMRLNTTFFDLDLVSLCILVAVFGVGFAAVTGAAFIWIQMNQAVSVNEKLTTEQGIGTSRVATSNPI
jgi:hypothetical protein